MILENLEKWARLELWENKVIQENLDFRVYLGLQVPRVNEASPALVAGREFPVFVVIPAILDPLVSNFYIFMICIIFRFNNRVIQPRA